MFKSRTVDRMAFSEEGLTAGVKLQCIECGPRFALKSSVKGVATHPSPLRKPCCALRAHHGTDRFYDADRIAGRYGVIQIFGDRPGIIAIFGSVEGAGFGALSFLPSQLLPLRLQPGRSSENLAGHFTAWP
jgi:hypothetical protein